MDEFYQQMQEQTQHAQECEAELFHSIAESIQAAIDLGLARDHVEILCYAAGIQIEQFRIGESK